MAENRELALILKLVADQFNSEMKKSGGVVGEFQKFIGDWRTQLTLAGTALFAIAKSTANFGEEALKTSQRLGLTVEKTTALQYAAHLADVPVMTLERGLQTLALRAVEAARGSGEGAKLFASLGISATDTAGKVKPLDHLFFEFQDRLKGVGNQAEFVEAGVSGLGKGFREFVPLIRQGSDATKAMMEEGHKLGATMSGEQAQAASRFNDELKRLTASVDGVTHAVGIGLIPVMTAGAETLTTIIAKMRLLNDETTNVGQNLRNLSDAFGQTRMGQGLMDAFTALGFGHRKGEGTLPREQFWFDLMKSGGGLRGQSAGSGVLSNEPGGTSPGGGSTIVDHDKLGKAKLEIFLMQNRALEIQQRHANNIERVEREMFEAVGARRQRMGEMIVQQTQLEVRIREAAAQQERDQLAENLQAWIAYDDQVGASTALRYQHQLDLLRANLAQQSQLTVEEAGRLLIAWQNHDQQLADEILARTTLTGREKETIEIEALTRSAAANEAASDDVFAGWAKGMDRYVRDTQSGFGLGADMARRTAQMMEQSFRTFFFDVWDGKIKSMRDVLEGLADFAKQVMGTVFSQLATKAVLGAFGFGAAGGGEVIRRFAMGGPVLGAGNLDTVPALLTPGEFVLSRGDVHEIKNGLVGGGGVTIQINNYGDNEVQASPGERGPDGRQLIRITVRDMVRGMIQGGDMDRSMSQRYGLTPSPGRR